MNYIEQTPAELLDWSIDYTCKNLGTDTIVSSVWAGSAPDFTLSNPSYTPTTTTIWITGGQPGNIYYITNTITTANGRQIQKTINYNCIAQREI